MNSYFCDYISKNIQDKKGLESETCFLSIFVQNLTVLTSKRRYDKIKASDMS